MQIPVRREMGRKETPIWKKGYAKALNDLDKNMKMTMHCEPPVLFDVDKKDEEEYGLQARSSFLWNSISK